MKYTLTENNLHICDSYLITKHVMRITLEFIRDAHPGAELFQKRSMSSMTAEWVVHNALHRLGIQRARTADVDINHPLPAYEKIGYALLFPFAWIIAR